MKTLSKILMISMMGLFLLVLPGGLWAQNPPAENTQEIIALLREQNSELSNEIRRIHREIAALRADLDKPDVKDVFGGIGYILGLCGVAALVAARRTKGQE